MHCPMCQRIMSLEQIREAGFYLCRDCRGLWLQMGELVKLAKTIGPNDLPQHRTSMDAEVGVPVEIVLACSGCGQAMSKHEYAFDSGIMIDRCSGCGSIWLDADKIFLIQRHLVQSVPEPGEAVGLLGKPWQSGFIESVVEDDLDSGGLVLGFVLEGLGELLLELLD